jgi:hypothetical protein
MPFAFTPDDGPPNRIMRYITLPDQVTVSIYDHDNNTVLINRTTFDQLGEYDRRCVLRTHQPYLTIHDFELGQAA